MLNNYRAKCKECLNHLSINRMEDITGRKRFFILSIILASITISVIGTAIVTLYQNSIDAERDRLYNIVKVQSSYVKTVASYNLHDYYQHYDTSKHSTIQNQEGLVNWATNTTLLEILNSRNSLTKFAETGEFTITQQIDTTILLLMSSRNHTLYKPRSLSLKNSLGEPIRRALSGQSGTMITLDYRGVEVLAAYSPVSSLNLGIVAKIDMNEVKSPFLVAAIKAGMIGLLFTLVGIFLFEKITTSVIMQLEKMRERFNLALTGSELGIWDWDIVTDMVTINERWAKMLGYDTEEIDAGLSRRTSLVHPDDNEHKTAILSDHLAGKTNVYQCQYRMKSKTGEWVWVLDKGKVVERDKKGKPIRMSGTHLDITERKKTEEELEQLHAAMRQTAAFAINNPGPVLRANSDGIICDANPATSKIFGNDILGKSLSTIFSSNKQLLNTGIKYGSPIQFEQSLDDKVFLFTLMKDDATSSNFLYGIDISDRKRIELELVKLTQALEQSPVAVLITDNKQSIEYVNQSYVDMTGYSAYEIIGKKQIDYVTNRKTRKIYFDLLRTLKRGDVWTREYEETRKTGETYWVSATVVPIKNESGVKTNYLGLLQDITNRKQAEEELRKLSQAVEQSPASIVITNLQAEIEYVNPKFEELTGYSFEEAIGKNPRLLNSGHQPRETYDEMWEAITNDKTWAGEFQNKKKNGELYWEAVAMSPIRNESGKTTHYLAIKEDITEKKMLEEELAVAQQLESIGVLAGGIAHDFNNILTAIMGNISLAKLKAEAGSLMHELLGEAEKASIRAKDLTNQLLTFSKGGSPVLKSALITDVIKESVQFALHGSSVSCDIDIANNLNPTHIDENQISQVITNLVINARQAMPEGGKVFICCKNCNIANDQLLNLKPGAYVCVSVRDTGIGISTENLEKIFDPYFTTKKTGSGLGLATSFSIAKKHGGILRAESTVGEGTTFTLYLPASMSESAPTTQEKDDEILSGNGRILVMDDEQPIRRALCTMLNALGYESESSAEGKTALKQFSDAKRQGKPFDAVILDMTVPGGMGGKETLEKLLELEPNVKAIVSSGYSDDSVVAQYEEYGFCGQVPKPYQLHELSRVLNSVLNSKGVPA